MAEESDHERRLAALAELIAAYEAEHGEISEEEMAAQARQDREEAAALRARMTT